MQKSISLQNEPASEPPPVAGVASRVSVSKFGNEGVHLYFLDQGLG